MRRSRKPIVIVSRRSTLSVAQARLVGEALARLHPDLAIKHLHVDSEGDEHPSAALASLGGKGLFTKRLEQMLLAGEADIAVHSLKDLPADVVTPGLSIAVVPRRADVRDCLVTHTGARSIEQLPQAAVVATSSPRRAAQVLRLRPDLRVVPLRGNVDTRIRRILDEHAADATLLAAAGLQRLGRADLIEHAITTEQVMPAASQGALALQIRGDDHVTLTRCLPLNHAPSAAAVHAERAVVAGLGAGCDSSIAVLAEPIKIDPKSVKRNADAHWFRLRVRVLSADGVQCLEVDERIKTKDLRRLVKRVIADLQRRGAAKLLSSTRPIPQPETQLI